MNNLDLFGVVGTDVRASTVKQFLKDNEGLPVRVSIDSPGGNLSEGVLIFNLLKEHAGEVTTVNVARAYSIASYIFLAGDVRQMNDNALLMTHEARVDASSLTESSVDRIKSMLSAANASIRKAYARVMGVDENMIQTLWDGGADVWYTAAQAEESGLSTETITAGDGLRAEYIDELVAIAPDYIVKSVTDYKGNNMSKVTIDALEKLGCPAGFILEQVKNEVSEVDALRAYIDLLNEKEEEVKDEDGEEGEEEKDKSEEMDAEEEEKKPEAEGDEEEKPEAEEGEKCPHCGADMPKEDPEAEEHEEKPEDMEEDKPEAEGDEKEPEAEGDEKEPEAEEEEEEPKAIAGAEPVATARQSNGRFTSASHAWKQQIADRCRETGCSATDAALFLNKVNPELRQMVINEANHKR